MVGGKRRLFYTGFVTTGVGDGARTGLASVINGIASLLATYLGPLGSIVPYEAATPALVIVGCFTLGPIKTLLGD